MKTKPQYKPTSHTYTRFVMARENLLARLPITLPYMIRVFDFKNVWLKMDWLKHVHQPASLGPWYWIGDAKTPCRTVAELIECIHATYHMLVYLAHLDRSIARLEHQPTLLDKLPEYDANMVLLWSKAGRALPYPTMPPPLATPFSILAE